MIFKLYKTVGSVGRKIELEVLDFDPASLRRTEIAKKLEALGYSTEGFRIIKYNKCYVVIKQGIDTVYTIEGTAKFSSSRKPI